MIVKDPETVIGYPKSGTWTIRPDGELMVGAVIGTSEFDKERLVHLVSGGFNAVLSNSSQETIYLPALDN